MLSVEPVTASLDTDHPLKSYCFSTNSNLIGVGDLFFRSIVLPTLYVLLFVGTVISPP